ncbi:uncharacterized protein LOC141532912 [Cotesia typhae]|uniref:uncharacterized protein LOC141532912 n=1 Tax=Cotesia typhae TaxID=2053667 RepID=UPI003D6846DB
MILSLLIILTAQLYSVQGEFGVILRDAVCPYYDSEYVTEPDIYVDDNNGIFFNFSSIQALPSTVEGRFRMIGASMGEYVVDTRLNVHLPLCEMLDEPVILGPLL